MSDDDVTRGEIVRANTFSPHSKRNGKRIIFEVKSSREAISWFFENGIFRLLTVSDVALVLRCSAGTVRNWIYRGLIPTVRPMPRMVRIDPRELLNWLSERKQFG